MSFDSNAGHDLIDAPDLATDSSSGRATWDERGNSIWEWQTAPGVYSREISAQQLKELEARHLHLMDGHQVTTEQTIWSRNARTTASRTTVATEMVLPRRSQRVDRSGFENFLNMLGLPA